MKLRSKIFLIGFIIGIILFFYFIYKLGPEALVLISSNLNLRYFGIYCFLTVFTFIPLAWRLQVILKSHGEKVSVWSLFKQGIAGFAVSYTTPSVRIGGEPLKVYMLKKENNVDMKVGSSAVILDKFIEFLGTMGYGLIALIVLLLIPGIPNSWRAIFLIIVGIGFWILFVFYKRTMNKQGSFSSLFVLLRLSRFSDEKKILPALKDMEAKMENFFKNHKQTFIMGCFFYFISAVVIFLEYKFLFLTIGVSLTFPQLFLFLTLLGLVNFVPIPAALGILEAGQAGLLQVLKGEGSIGLAISLLIRVRNLFFVAIGFLILSEFSGKEFYKDYKIYQKKKMKA